MKLRRNLQTQVIVVDFCPEIRSYSDRNPGKEKSLNKLGRRSKGWCYFRSNEVRAGAGVSEPAARGAEMGWINSSHLLNKGHRRPKTEKNRGVSPLEQRPGYRLARAG